jgi:hypothetical protein
MPGASHARMRPRKGLAGQHPGRGLVYRILANVAVMPLHRLAARHVPRFALLACLSFGTSVSAGEPQTAADRRGRVPAGPVDRDAGQVARRDRRADDLRARRVPQRPVEVQVPEHRQGQGHRLRGDPRPLLPDSTLRYLASACMDLFGGATLCQCAAQKQIETYIKAEDAAKAKADKKAAADAKKKKAKTK